MSQQVAKAREQIQSSLKQQRKSPLTTTTGGVDPEEEAMLREENLRLKKNVEDLQSQVRQLTDRVSKLEVAVGGSAKSTPPVSSGDSNKKVEEDDDVDLFGSDEEVNF